MEIRRDYIFLASKITEDGDYSHEIKKKKKTTLTFWKTNCDQSKQHIKKQRHYFIDKAMVFPVVMYGCESWTIKKAEH